MESDTPGPVVWPGGQRVQAVGSVLEPSLYVPVQAGGYMKSGKGHLVGEAQSMLLDIKGVHYQKAGGHVNRLIESGGKHSAGTSVRGMHHETTDKG